MAILDADKTGFLRSTRSLIQISGRAARNVDGKVVFYADEITDAIQKTLDITNRRRAKQLQFNLDNGITPKSINKTIEQIMQSTAIAEGYASIDRNEDKEEKTSKEDFYQYLELDNRDKMLELLKKEMKRAASRLDFERAAESAGSDFKNGEKVAVVISNRQRETGQSEFRPSPLFNLIAKSFGV